MRGKEGLNLDRLWIAAGRFTCRAEGDLYQERARIADRRFGAERPGERLLDQVFAYVGAEAPREEAEEPGAMLSVNCLGLIETVDRQGCASALHRVLHRDTNRFVEYTPWLNTRQRVGIAVMSARQILAVNLRRLREQVGISQEELAERAEIDRTYVSALEREVYAASVDVIERLATGLGVEAWELLKP